MGSERGGGEVRRSNVIPGLVDGKDEEEKVKVDKEVNSR